MTEDRSPRELKGWLEELYDHYNDRGYVHPDPVEFLYEYDNLEDREIVAFVASSLAYGRVPQILASVRKALDIIGGSPFKYVTSEDPTRIRMDFSGFRHRFTNGEQMAVLLGGLGQIIQLHGSVGSAFSHHLMPSDTTVGAPMARFVDEMSSVTGQRLPFLLPTPLDGSACKRFCLMLRWMVRSDEVDPGGWSDVPVSKLLVPLDTHMFRLARMLGFTSRVSADYRATIEVTEAFRAFRPDDPVRYDFALTRQGIRPEKELMEVS